MPGPSSTFAPPISIDSNSRARLAIIDVARGVAIVQMVAYHFCYDLSHFGWLHVALTREPGWIAWRSAIVTQFLALVGVCMALPVHADPPGLAARVAARTVGSRRWWQIAGCAALVSAASALLFGSRWIWFGILHFVVVAQALLAPLRVRPRTALALGGVALVLGLAVTLPAFAPDGLNWIGFGPYKPRTEDFVPLLPWLGVVLLGRGAGGLWFASAAPWADRLRRWAPRVPAALTLAGRWPLTVYMLHQPLLFGLLQLAKWLGGAAGAS